MANHDALAIANEFLKLNGTFTPSQMQLQKLVYLANGWNLAINNEALVSDRVEAWDGGPVFRAIWNHLRDYGRNSTDRLYGDPRTKSAYLARLNDSEKSIIQKVWNRYSQYTGLELSNMTHQPGTPWSNAYYGTGRNAVIPSSDIKQHFKELALAGRNSNS